MAYWLDEGWHAWTEIDEAGTPAAGLYARCGSYIADALTDGFVPAPRALMYGTQELIDTLVDVGLWEPCERPRVKGRPEVGYRDLRYFPLNATREEIERRRDAAAARQRKSRAARTPQSHTDVTRDNSVSHSAPYPFPSIPNGMGEGMGAEEFGEEDPAVIAASVEELRRAAESTVLELQHERDRRTAGAALARQSLPGRRRA